MSPRTSTPATAGHRIALPLVLLAALLAALAVACITLLSAARAYVGGESQWSRSQKTAVMHLLRYAGSRADADWQRYERAIAVPLGDRRAREELDSPHPDLARLREGFIAGLNHPDDIDGMVRLYRWFGSLPFIARAIQVWAEADARIAELATAADALRAAAERGDTAAIAAAVGVIEVLDERLTPLQMRFSATLGEASRLAHLLLVAAVVLSAATLAALVAQLVRRATARSELQAQALRESETLFRSLWETTDDAVLIVSTDHLIRFANPAAHALFGHAQGALAGQPLTVVQPERLRAGHRAGVARHMGSGQRHLDWAGTEVTALHAQGHEFPAEIRFGRFELAGESLFVGFLRDITQRKQAERAILEANEGLERRVAERTQELSAANARLQELDRLKSQFLATMSHELRTPLNSILGFTGVLQRGLAGPLAPEQQRQLGFVHESGKHLLHLINDLLDLSRIESGRMEVQREGFDFAGVVAEAVGVLRPLADVKALALKVDVLTPMPMEGDRRKTYQVLLNLVGNAVKFTERGSVTVSARVADGVLAVHVHDTGPGIAPQQQSRLFEAFTQLDGAFDRSHEGTGLGLHLSRKLLALMGGQVGVRSAPGAGSTFWFVMPAAPSMNEARPAPEEAWA